MNNLPEGAPEPVPAANASDLSPPSATTGEELDRFKQEWDESQILQGSAYWQEVAEANDGQAAEYQTKADAEPADPDLGKLAQTYLEIAANARALAEEARSRGL